MSDSDRRARFEAGVSTEQLQAYLQSKQWFKDGNIRSVATVWHRSVNEHAEVILPFPSAKDYRKRLRLGPGRKSSVRLLIQGLQVFSTYGNSFEERAKCVLR